MGKQIDLINQVFGKLTVKSKTRKNGRVAWTCECECGNITDVITNSLTSGNTKSCGCGSNKPNEIGKRYGKLLVISQEETKNHKSQWLCQCDCGNEIIVSGDNLRQGKTQSCGCLKIIDETGNKYFRLIVIDFAYIKNNCAYWNCECECGNKIVVAGNHLRSGHTKSCGCMKSMGEFLINQILSENNINYTTQYTIPSQNNGCYRFDFAILDENNNPIRFIEFDGEQHYEDKCTPYYGVYEEIHQRDLMKNEYCKNNNIPLIRIPYWERENITLEKLLNLQYLI